MLNVGDANIYYECAGHGRPLVFIHAGVADSRQWNNEFQHFSKQFKAIRYDLRGFGKSEPVAGEFSHLQDLQALLKHLQIEEPIIFVGCSMGGSLAMDYALTEPANVSGLVLVGSGPSGLRLDVARPAKFELVEKADAAGDLERVAELETQIWFDGSRATHQVDREMRALAYQMNLTALHHDEKALGTKQPDTDVPAAGRLDQLSVPLLAITGENDIPFMHGALEVMQREVADYRQVVMSDAAHLPNMDHPDTFRTLVQEFIESLPIDG